MRTVPRDSEEGVYCAIPCSQIPPPAKLLSCRFRITFSADVSDACVFKLTKATIKHSTTATASSANRIRHPSRHAKTDQNWPPTVALNLVKLSSRQVSPIWPFPPVLPVSRIPPIIFVLLFTFLNIQRQVTHRLGQDWQTQHKISYYDSYSIVSVAQLKQVDDSTNFGLPATCKAGRCRHHLPLIEALFQTINIINSMSIRDTYSCRSTVQRRSYDIYLECFIFSAPISACSCVQTATIILGCDLYGLRVAILDRHYIGGCAELRCVSGAR
jgi:hypothetical protein